MPTILLIDDSVERRVDVADMLRRNGHTVVERGTGTEGLAAMAEYPDLVLLDLMLPDIDSRDVCRRIRAVSTIPVLVLTAGDDDEEMIRGLEVGVDDYITKPFKPQELLARMHAHLRRASMYAAAQNSAPDVSERLVRGPIMLGLNARCAWVDGTELALTHTEFDILRLLMQRTPAAVPREEILSHIWGGSVVDLDSRTVDNHIARLRRKLQGRASQAVETVPGTGYRFRSNW